MRSDRLLLVVLAGAALGSSAVMTRLGVSEIPPLPLVAMRLSVGTVLFAGTLLLLRRTLPRHPRVLMDMVIVGITTVGIPLVLFTAALQYISSPRLWVTCEAT